MGPIKLMGFFSLQIVYYYAIVLNNLSLIQNSNKQESITVNMIGFIRYMYSYKKYYAPHFLKPYITYTFTTYK